MMNAPRGTPGAANARNTAANATVASSRQRRAECRKTSAMNSAPTVHDTGAATLNVDTASGSTKPVMRSGKRELGSALSTSAGSDAIDELELNAISCGGSAARAKRRIGTPPNIATAG